MAALTEAQRERLQAFRQQKAKKRIWLLRRKLLLLLALAGLSASYYGLAIADEPCFADTLICVGR